MDHRGILIPYFLIAILLAAAASDIRFHKIPNWLTYPAMLAGILYHSMVNGLDGLFLSITGAGVGIAVLLVLYLMGGMGAGDVKLMGAIGGLLGPKGVFAAFIFTALTGGIYTLFFLAFHGYLKETFQRYWMILKTFVFTKRLIYFPPSEKEKEVRLPYGIAIALGTLFSVFMMNKLSGLVNIF